MQEIDGIVDGILRPMEKDGVTVQFQYAEDMAKLPAVTYYVLTESESFRADNTEQSQIARVQVDVWTFKRSDMSRISIKVNELMQSARWMRELCRDVPKPSQTEQQCYHRTMRFAKEFWGGE